MLIISQFTLEVTNNSANLSAKHLNCCCLFQSLKQSIAIQYEMFDFDCFVISITNWAGPVSY